jgi:hypothetical protein
MQKRAAKAKRILAAQQKLHRMEQWKLAELQQQLAALKAAQIELIDALNGENALHGLFIDTTARRLGTLAEQEQNVAHAAHEQSLRTKEHAARERVSERFAQATVQDLERELERKELVETIEQLLATGRTSLP